MKNMGGVSDGDPDQDTYRTLGIEKLLQMKTVFQKSEAATSNGKI